MIFGTRFPGSTTIVSQSAEGLYMYTKDRKSPATLLSTMPIF